MKKVLIIAVCLGGIATSWALTNNSEGTKTNYAKKVFPCREVDTPCPDGGGTQVTCTRDAGVRTPFCDQYETTDCNVIFPCR